MRQKQSIRIWLAYISLVSTLVFGLLTIFSFTVYGISTMVESEKTIFDFTTADSLNAWTVVNDGVMGGVSQSQIRLTANDSAVFQGVVSLENNGGFASIRTYPADYQLAGYDGLKVRVRGDGQDYQLRLRTDRYFDGANYTANFATEADRWIIVKAPFSQFSPTFRGRTLPNMPPLDGANIQQFGFMISDKQVGPFQLEIDWIKAYQWENANPDNRLRGPVPW